MSASPHSVSSYLPSEFTGAPIALLAGKGRYPILAAERIRAAGIPLRLISFANETDAELIASFDPEHHAEIKLGQLGKLLKALGKLGCAYVLMAGQVTPKRLFDVRPDLKALRILNSLKLKNAETIFGALADQIEGIGVHVLDARCFIDDQMASEGKMTLGKLRVEQEDIEHGIRIAKAITELDIGQGAVVRKGTVLAVEAYEGTDHMLRRAGTFKTDGLIFAKTVKRVQDYRFDVPVFGSRTLEVMHEAGIRTAALEAERVILLDKEAVLKQADRLKISLIGFRSE